MKRRIDDPVARQAPIRVPAHFRREFPWAPTAAIEAVFNIVRTADLIGAGVGDLIRPFGLSPAGYSTLIVLRSAGEPLPPRILHQRLLVPPQTLTGLLDQLERRALVRRISHPSDRRGVLVELTDEGRSLLRDSLAPVVGRAEMAWLACLTLEEQEALIQILGKLQTHLYECMDPDPDHPDLAGPGLLTASPAAK